MELKVFSFGIPSVCSEQKTSEFRSKPFSEEEKPRNSLLFCSVEAVRLIVEAVRVIVERL
jgi:hypothetical protein